jgi:hypothetical protein
MVQQAGDGSEVQVASESEARATVKLCVHDMLVCRLADELLPEIMQRLSARMPCI